MVFNELFLSKEECDKIISMGDGKWETSLLSYKKEMENLRKSTQHTPITNKGEWLYNIIKRCFSKIGVTLTADTLYENQILKYDEGGFIFKHQDIVRYDENGIQTDRYYVLNIVLNDEFEGGDFVLYDKNDSPRILDKMVGVGAIFKTNEYHEVKKISKGTRYSFSVFIHDCDFELKQQVI